ncbi:MAG TPA: ABC transporter substrate-binding protein, partial [Clostridiales bacterium]|nr:ABC transporter substrate-binding protein [Clostridiales bacterium]
MAKRLQKALLLLAVAAMLPVSLYGCTGDTGASPSDPPAANTDELPQEKNSVTVGIAQDLDTLDPHKAASAGVSEVLFNLYEGLVKVNAEGGVSGAVASDYTISEDKTVYTFTLREGVTFHNGAPVTMDDVLYSLKRCAGSENDGVPLISAFSDVTDISAVDDTHVAVTLSKPSLEFLYSMTAAIIPQGSGDTIATNPVGTGPFAFQSYTPQESLVAKRYDGYWGTPAYLEEVTFRIISSAETMVMSLKSGVLDMVIHLPNTMAAEVKEGFTVHEDTMKLVQALYLNNAVKPLDDVRVRQAMYYAIDVNEIIEFVCNGAGVATGTSMYPAHTKYFLPELATAYQKNLDKARELLAQA